MKYEKYGKTCVFFTIVELLVVISIIGVVMALLLPTLAKARGVAKQTACLSNLRQVGTGIQLYKSDYTVRSRMYSVPFTSLLFPDYLKSNKVFQCPSDLNKELNGSLTDNDPAWLEKIDNDWNEIYDRDSADGVKSVGVNGYMHNPAAGNVSYFYEMSDCVCNFGFTVSRAEAGLPGNTADTTWAMWKEIHGFKPWGAAYSEAEFPIYRCFWHIKHIKNYSASPGKQIPNTSDPVISITYSGNYVLSKARWEDGVWSP